MAQQLTADGVLLRPGDTVYFVDFGSGEIKARTADHVEGHKVVYATPDRDGYIGCKLSAAYALWHNAQQASRTVLADLLNRKPR